MNTLLMAAEAGDQITLDTVNNEVMWYTITSGVSSFISGVLVPVANFCTQSEVPLAFLSVTLLVLGIRILRRTIGAFGRGR